LLQALADLNSEPSSLNTLAQADQAPIAAQQATRVVHLAVIGKSHHAEFERQAADLGIAAQVHFLGSLQGAQAMAQAYQAADALAHPTLEDSYAMVVQEALSHGMPVVVSDATYCGIAAHLQHAHNALILPKPRDAKALASLIKQALFDTALRQHLREQGLAFARAHSTAQTLAAYLAIYEQVAQTSPHRRSSEVVKTQAQKSPTE
jgi:UDP-glucose:(heptosyl)LPS alpha-1,3-glucosyltransferase